MARVSQALGLLPLLLAACAAPDVPTPAGTSASLTVEPSADPDGISIPGSSPSADWPRADSCASLVRELAGMQPEAVRALEAAESPLAMASLDAGKQSVRADLPIPQVAPTLLEQGRCAILVGAAQPTEPTTVRVLDRRLVHSAYPTGTKRRRNPEHQQLETELAAARRDDSDGGDVLKTGDPLLDLIGIVANGVIGGISAVSSQREIRAIEAALEDTPPFIEDPILTPYRYELVEVEAGRGAVLPVVLHDGSGGRAWRTTITLSEQRRFAIADERQAADTQPPPGRNITLTTSDELARWRTSIPPVATSTILAHLAAAGQANEPAPASLEVIIAELRTGIPHSPQGSIATAEAPTTSRLLSGAPPLDKPLKREPPSTLAAMSATAEPAAGASLLLDSPVLVERADTTGELPAIELLELGDGAAFGFYVTAEHIVAPAEALGRSSLIAVRYPDGMRAHGLVELVDADLGLALVYLPRAGEPVSRRMTDNEVPLHGGQPGMPWITEGVIGGVFVNDPLTASPSFIDAGALERFIGRLAAL